MPYDLSGAAEIIRLASRSVPECVENRLRELLSSRPRRLHTSLSYDPNGSDLFAELCRQPEYYLTRTEFALLYREASALIDATEPSHIIDLGCGNFEKTQVLIHEAVKQSRHVDFVPCDIDEHIITSSLPHLAHFYGAGLRVQALVGAYETCLSYLAGSAGRRLFTFLGSTYGNLSRPERESLLKSLSFCMAGDDRFLLAVDLVKSPDVLEAAYNDRAGCIAASMMRMLITLNRDYGADFNLEAFEHVSRYEPARRMVVSYLVSRIDQDVRIDALDLDLGLMAGEPVQAEIREKFVVHDLLRDLADYGFAPIRVTVDDTHPYALLLLSKARSEGASGLANAA